MNRSASLRPGSRAHQGRPWPNRTGYHEPRGERRDAMPTGGKLTVTTVNTTLDKNHLKNFPVSEMSAGDYVMLGLADTGTGMSEEVKAHLFEPFFTTKPPGTGTGLVWRLASGSSKQNTGHINVHSELGSGTTFKIYFPQVQSALEPPPAFATCRPQWPEATKRCFWSRTKPVVRELAVATLRRKATPLWKRATARKAFAWHGNTMGKLIWC